MLIHKQQTNLWIKLPTIPPGLAGKIVKKLLALGSNQIAGFGGFRPLSSLEKTNYFYFLIFHFFLLYFIFFLSASKNRKKWHRCYVSVLIPSDAPSRKRFIILSRAKRAFHAGLSGVRLRTCLWSSFHIKNTIHCADSILSVCHSIMSASHSIMSVCLSIMSSCHSITISHHTCLTFNYVRYYLSITTFCH